MKVRYNHNNPKWKLKQIDKGDWTDLHVTKILINNQSATKYNAFEEVVVEYGFAAELPADEEAHIAPRSSTFEKYGLILTNSPGIIDNSYKGDDDIWKCKFFSLRAGEIKVGDRLAHFRVFKKQPRASYEEVETLGNENRGGYGTTGTGSLHDIS